MLLAFYSPRNKWFQIAYSNEIGYNSFIPNASTWHAFSKEVSYDQAFENAGNTSFARITTALRPRPDE
jgi:hypothetical protein